MSGSSRKIGHNKKRSISMQTYALRATRNKARKTAKQASFEQACSVVKARYPMCRDVQRRIRQMTRGE